MFSERDMGGSDTNDHVYTGDPLSDLAESQGDRVDHPRRETDMIDEPLTGALVQYLEILTGRSFEQYVQEQGGRAAVIAELKAVLNPAQYEKYQKMEKRAKQKVRERARERRAQRDTTLSTH